MPDGIVLGRGAREPHETWGVSRGLGSSQKVNPMPGESMALPIPNDPPTEIDDSSAKLCVNLDRWHLDVVRFVDLRRFIEDRDLLARGQRDPARRDVWQRARRGNQHV